MISTEGNLVKPDAANLGGKYEYVYAATVYHCLNWELVRLLNKPGSVISAVFIWIVESLK